MNSIETQLIERIKSIKESNLPNATAVEENKSQQSERPSNEQASFNIQNLDEIAIHNGSNNRNAKIDTNKIEKSSVNDKIMSRETSSLSITNFKNINKSTFKLKSVEIDENNNNNTIYQNHNHNDIGLKKLNSSNNIMIQKDENSRTSLSSNIIKSSNHEQKVHNTKVRNSKIMPDIDNIF